MAGGDKTKVKVLKVGSSTRGPIKRRNPGLARSSSLATSGLSTMSTRQYVGSRARADIAKVKKAYNSPTGKKVRSTAKGFGASVAKASKSTINAGKQARKLYSKLR